MDASFFSKPLSQLECRDNKKSCHLLEKNGTHPMRMHDNNTTYNRSNQNVGFLDTIHTTCNRSNQNARLPDTHSCSTNQHPATPDNKNHMLPKHGIMLKSIPCWIMWPGRQKLFHSQKCNLHHGKCNICPKMYHSSWFYDKTMTS